MGCCQSSTVSSADQVTLEPSKELIPKNESPSDPSYFTSIPEIHVLKFDTQKSPTLSPSNSTFYTLGAKLSSSTIINRFVCTYSQSISPKEIIILRKSSILPKDVQKLMENSTKISQFHTENIVKIVYVGEDSDFVKIITEPCGERTLEDLVLNSKIPFGPALAFVKQIMQGVMQYHKLGVILKYLSESDVFIVNNSVKISVSATILKSSDLASPDSEINLKNDVWSLGVIFLKLLLAPTEFVSVEDALLKLKLLKLHPEDTKTIQSMFKPLSQRPSLPEILNFTWQSNQPIKSSDSKSKQNYIIEKISEEPSESIEENQSERIEKDSGSSNEFYQSEDLDEDQQSDFKDWQEVDMNNKKIRVCEILNDMKEIIESIPDHEVSSFDNQSNDALRSLPETPIITQDSPAALLIISDYQNPEEDSLSKIPLSSSLYSPQDPNAHVKTISELHSIQLKGTVKFFSLLKKTGLVTCSATHEDYVLSQDELMLSGVDLQHFTKQVLSGSTVQLQFSLSGNKAVEISLLPYQ